MLHFAPESTMDETGTGPKQAELVSFPAMTRGSVGLGIELVILDHVLHPASRAIELLV